MNKNSIKRDETMMKKIVTIGLGIVLLLLTACSPQPLQTIGTTKYYVAIGDKGKAQENKTEDVTRYEYHLPGFDKNGEAENLTFTAGHELKQGAFLRIYYKKDEVITYEEVENEDIPEKAMDAINAEE